MAIPCHWGDTDKDALSATIVTRDAADRRITIRIKTKTTNTTKLSIRVGTFGDETKSHLIYNKIVEHLKAGATAPPTPVQVQPESSAGAPSEPAPTPPEPSVPE